MKNLTRVISLFCVMAMIVTAFAIPQKANAASVVEDLSNLTFLGAPLSDYTVVLGSDATTGIKNTLNYFIDYVKEATGAELKIANEGEVNKHEICIGKTDRETEKVTAARDSLTYNGIAIVADGNKIFLTGADQLGVIYSMYQFLEDYLGFRFYSIDYHVAKLKYVKEFPADLNYTYSPVFEGRDTTYINVYPVNGMKTEQPDLEFSNSLKINGDFARRVQHSGAENFGGGNYFAGDASHDGFVHTIGILSETSGGQPCLTDENVYQTVLANVRKRLDANPDVKVVDVSQNDNWEYCKCENCAAIDMAESPDGVSPNPMGSLLTFVNRLAKEIKKDYPDVYVSTLAYAYSRIPPKNIVPEENVMIRLCNIECCFAHALSDESCAYSDGVNAQLMENIKTWSDISTKLYVWDYTTNYRAYVHTFANFDAIWDNIQTFKNNKVIYVFEQGNGEAPNVEFVKMRTYLHAKLMWNPDITEDEYWQMLDEFLQDFYGPGWRYIRKYIDLTTESAQKYHMGIYAAPASYIRTPENTPESNKEFYSMLCNLWNKAYNRADNDAHRTHVRQSRTQAEFLYLEHFYDAATDMERADELYCDLIGMKATVLREGYRNLFPRRWKFVLGPAYWWSR